MKLQARTRFSNCSAMALVFVASVLTSACAKHAPDRSCETAADCRRQCDAGAIGACTRLAHSEMFGIDGEPRDLQAALTLLQRACGADEAVACLDLSAHYRSAIGVPRDRAKADQLRDKAIVRLEAECKTGDADSCFTLFTLRKSGPAGINNPDQAATLLQRATKLARTECSQHRPVSCRILAGAVELLPDREVISPEGIVMLEEACNGGSAAACSDRANQVWFGVGGTKDEALARRYFERALDLLKQQCDAGVADRCVLLGSWAGNDDKFLQTPRDNAQAYIKACDLGDPIGCVYAAPNIGRAFGNRPADPERGDELEKKGIAILETGCEEGSGAACLDATQRIIVRIVGHRDVAQDHPRYLADYKRGVSLLDEDCSNGDRAACKNLADVFATTSEGKFGDKIHADPAKSKTYFEKACQLGGDTDACKKAAEITPPPPKPVPEKIEVPLTVLQASDGGLVAPTSSSAAPPPKSPSPSAAPAPSGSH